MKIFALNSECACLQIEICFKISRINDSDKQTKLCLSFFNRPKFLIICMLKYHLKCMFLVIYKPYYQATVYCNTKILFLETFSVPILHSSKKNQNKVLIRSKKK